MKKKKTIALSFPILFLVFLFTLNAPLFAPNHGCTPGYWKNHLDAWVPTGYSPSAVLNSVFINADIYGLGNVTLLNALKFKGGSGDLGAARILLRTAVAALLNVAHPNVYYRGRYFGFDTVFKVIDAVNWALDPVNGGRETMLELASELDGYNNFYCPLNGN